MKISKQNKISYSYSKDYLWVEYGNGCFYLVPEYFIKVSILSLFLDVESESQKVDMLFITNCTDLASG